MNRDALNRFCPREYAMFRVEALWRHSPEARDAVVEALRHAAVTDPHTATPDQVRTLAYALYDLDGKYPDAEHHARVMLARSRGAAIGRGGGYRSDAARFARDYLPELMNELLSAWDEARRAHTSPAAATVARPDERAAS